MDVIPAGFSTTATCLIEIADADVLFPRRRGQGVRQKFDDVHQPQPAAGLFAKIAVQGHLPRLEEPADLGPRFPRKPLAHRGGNGLIDLAGQNTEDFSTRVTLGFGHFRILPDHVFGNL